MLSLKHFENKDIKQLDEFMLAEGYSTGTFLYYSEYTLGVYNSMIIYICVSDTESYLIVSNVLPGLSTEEEIIEDLNWDKRKAEDKRNYVFGDVSKDRLWFEQILLSISDVNLWQQETVELDPLTIKDLTQSPWVSIDGIALEGKVLKIGISSNEFGLAPQPAEPEVLRSMKYFQKMLEFASTRSSNPITQKYIAEVQEYLL
jgi:hypothetical protein